MAPSRPIQRVDSASHPVVALARSLANPHGRKKSGLILLEGFRAITGALDAGAVPDSLLGTREAFSGEAGAAITSRLARSGCRILEITPALMEAVSQVESPQGIVMLCPPPRSGLDEILRAEFIVVADRISDPGNLGTIMRSAQAFGVGAMITTKGSVEAGNPKALRASAGSWPGLPVAEGIEAPAAVEALARAGFRIIVAESKGGENFRSLDWKGRVALVIGSEAHGPDSVFTASASARAFIPVSEKVESLNAATAASVILAEAASRRP
jgi:TrmH family RNA methyltransferase